MVRDVGHSSTDAGDKMRRAFEAMCRRHQDRICRAIEELDGGARFSTDAWTRTGGGGGISRVLRDGKVFEKAGCSVSVVYGTMPQSALEAATGGGDKGTATTKNVIPSNGNAPASTATRPSQSPRAKGFAPGARIPFFACGISSVIHPKNPMAPTMHFNYRFFQTEGGAWWFGGGTDISPAYLFEDDMRHFHGAYKEVCDRHDPKFYKRFKRWADNYFLIPHRGERRGLGGIFFDDLNDRDPEMIRRFSDDCLAAVVPSYLPLVARHKNDPFTAKQKRWQQLRRGRYVEFNLVYDRGTTFGLKTGGRIESILMSLPRTARWEYDHKQQPGSREAEIMQLFRTPRESWV
jgi:coproporphyrinogen III oxidase